MNEKSVLVIGSGGIGGLYGALLHKAGWQVDMVARSDHAIIASQGLQVDSILGNLSFKPRNVYSSVAQAGPAQWILLAIKMLPSTDIASLIAPAVGPDTCICLIANGLDIEVPLVRAYPTNSLVSGVAFVGSSRVKGGHVKHSAYGGLILGSYLQNNDECCKDLINAFGRSGIKVSVSQDIALERWKKSIWNASFNPLSVLTNGADTGRLLGTPEAEKLVRTIMAEVVACGRAEGYSLPDELIDKNIATTKAMSAYLTSMALDYLNGHEIELEAILGSVVHYGRKHQISIPHLETLYETLRIRGR